MNTQLKDGIADLDQTLPEGWASTRLGSVAESLTYGYTASASTGSKGPRFLRITDIQNGAVDWNSVPTCKIEQPDVAKYGLRSGDIVFARTGATTGKSYLIQSCPPAVFASYLIRLRPVPQVNPALLANFFQTADYWKFISDNVAGIAQPNCNATKLSELPIPIPPLKEQERLVEAIASCLSIVGAARERLLRVPAILKRFRQALLAAACSGRLTEVWRSAISPETAPVRTSAEFWSFLSEGDLPEIPKGWVWTTIDALAAPEKRSITDGPFGSNLKTEHYTTSGPRVIRLQNIGDYRFVDVKAHISNEHFVRLTKHRIQAGDVAIACLGDPIPRACVIPETVGPAIVKADCVRFKPDPRLAHERYICYALNNSSTRSRMSEIVHGVGRARLNLKQIKSIAVPLPPMAEQLEIVRLVELMLRLAEEVEKRVALAEERNESLAQSILAKAFRGELVPTEAELAQREGREYEPASVLLERIKQQWESNSSRQSERKGTRPKFKATRKGSV